MFDQPQYSRFYASLQKLGPTDRKRAEALRMTPRHFLNLKRLGPSGVITRFPPEALRALADDLEAAQTDQAA